MFKMGLEIRVNQGFLFFYFILTGAEERKGLGIGSFQRLQENVCPLGKRAGSRRQAKRVALESADGTNRAIRRLYWTA